MDRSLRLARPVKRPEQFALQLRHQGLLFGRQRPRVRHRGRPNVCETPAAPHDDRRGALDHGMTGRTSGPAVSLTKTSKTTHVLEVDRPPGGSVPPGPFPKVGSPVLATSRDPRPSKASPKALATGISRSAFCSGLGNLSASVPSESSIESWFLANRDT